MNTNGYTLFARLPGQPRTASDSTGFKAYVIVWHITAYDRYRPFEPYLLEKVKNQRLILANPPQSLAEKWRGWKWKNTPTSKVPDRLFFCYSDEGGISRNRSYLASDFYFKPLWGVVACKYNYSCRIV
jgi:hypothetical protein